MRESLSYGERPVLLRGRPKQPVEHGNEESQTGCRAQRPDFHLDQPEICDPTRLTGVTGAGRRPKGLRKNEPKAERETRTFPLAGRPLTDHAWPHCSSVGKSRSGHRDPCAPRRLVAAL